MANKVVLKRSSVAEKSPTTSDLALGELALNTFDGNLFFKKDVSGVQSILSVATLTGTQTLTNKFLIAPVIKGYVVANSNTTQTFAITVVNSGYGNVFAVDGVSVPTLSFVRTGVYTFVQSAASNSGHQLAFKDGAGNSYTTGVVTTGTPGSAGAQTVITVASDAPADLRYYCVAHGNGMGNTISVTGTGGAEIPGQIQLNCPVNTHGQIIASQPHSQAATNKLTLPGGSTIGNSDAVLVSDTGTQTLTNKTLTSPTLTTPVLGTPSSGTLTNCTFPTLNQNTTGTAANVTGIVAVANGGTGTATPSLVGGTNITITGSFPNQTITASGGSGGSGSVTSVAATVPSFLSVSGSPITTSGTLAITLSGTALPVANGGTGVTTSTGTGAVVLNTAPTLTSINITNTTISTTKTSGALTVAGGVGVGDSVYVGNRVGYVNASNVSVVYQVYNATANSLDTVFG